MLTQQRLRELLNYDHETGIFSRVTTRGSRVSGAIAGNISADNRVQIYVDNRNYKAHRLVWLYVFGQWPTYDIDHINGNPSDNRLCNLRDIPHRINLQNRQGPTKVNSTKMLGVTKNKKKFAAQIKINGKRIWLGTYDTPDEAHAVYLEMKRKHHEGNTL